MAEIVVRDAAAERRMILKNILLISIAFLMNFNAFQSLSRLQSSLHLDEGMGVINSSILYAALVLSCLFLPKIIIAKIGHKWTIPVSFMGYILWMAANGYAVWGTMVPASIIVGLAAAPLWTAQCSYFTLMGSKYAKLTNQSEESAVTRFFGIFFCFFQMSSITGSIISSTILKPVLVDDNGTSQSTDAYLMSVDDSVLEYCGGNDCPWNNVTNPNLEKPASHVVWTMLGVYIGIALGAVVLVSVFVDNLPDDIRPKGGVSASELKDMLLGTLKHLRHKEQLLLIPLTMYSGFEQALYSAEFSKSFITCSIGIWNVGLVTIPFGVVNALVSFGSGRIAKYTGRLPIFLAGLVVDICIQFTLIFWMPNPDQEYVLYILASMWGFTDGIWQTQINALYGVIFSKESEAAFSNYRMWESLGFIIAFAYSAYICTSTKLYVTISVLFLGMIGYLIVEFMTYKKSKAEEALGKQGMETANGTVNVGYEKTETPWSVAEPKSFDENRLSTKL